MLARAAGNNVGSVVCLFGGHFETTICSLGKQQYYTTGKTLPTTCTLSFAWPYEGKGVVGSLTLFGKNRVSKQITVSMPQVVLIAVEY